MKSSLAITLAIAAVLNAGSAQAAVRERDWKTPGDGLLTYDDINQREWLDLSVSRLSQFPEPRLANAIAEIGPGGLFEGFRWAKRNDVIALAQSAGIDTSTQNFAINEAVSRSLIDLLGITALFTGGTVHSIGFIDETDASPPFSSTNMGADFFVRFNSITGQGSSAGLFVSSGNDLLALPANGLMLYRLVPEPCSGLLAISGICGLLLAALRFRASFGR